MIFALALAAATLLHQQTILPGGKGPNRLIPNAALLSGAAPLQYDSSNHVSGGLEDLRLVDQLGREVPYLLLTPPPDEIPWRSALGLPITATATSSGFEADLGRMVRTDAVTIEGLPAPFLKRVRLEGSGDRVHWTLLQAEATLFDLDRGLRNLVITFPASELQYFRFTWDDRNSARVRRLPSVYVRTPSETVRLSEAVTIPLVPASQISSGGRTRYHLPLPGPQFPIGFVDVHVATGDVMRRASVTESPRVGSGLQPRLLGSGMLIRREQDGAVAEGMSVAVVRPSGSEIDLIVDNGNNPPLAIRSIGARLLPVPTIYFESDGSALTAHYGQDEAKAPSYDLEASRQKAERANASVATWSKPVVASVRESRANDQPIPVGGTIDPTHFAFCTKAITPATGLVVVGLSSDVLCRSARLADLRIVTASNQQVPYVIERRSDFLTLPLTMPVRKQVGSNSTYVFDLPYRAFPIGSRLLVETSNHSFERLVTFRKIADDDRPGSSAGETTNWATTQPVSPPPPLAISLGEDPASFVEVSIDEGDNAPLVLTSARIEVPSAAVRFYAPGTPIRFLYGSHSEGPPRYDIALLTERMLNDAARDVPMPQSQSCVEPSRPRWERLAFWVAMIAAIGALLLVLSRLIATNRDDLA